jgi:hypothetical protein
MKQTSIARQSYGFALLLFSVREVRSMVAETVLLFASDLKRQLGRKTL